MNSENDFQNFNVVDREILKNLLKRRTIDWYYFHEKYRLSPGQLSRSMKKLKDMNFITIGENKVSITESGIKKLILHRNAILRKKECEDWELPQIERIIEKLDLNTLYLPNQKKWQK